MLSKAVKEAIIERIIKEVETQAIVLAQMMMGVKLPPAEPFAPIGVASAAALAVRASKASPSTSPTRATGEDLAERGPRVFSHGM